MLRWAPTRAAGFILLVLLIVYWGLVPLLWPSPAIAVGVPTSAALDEDVPVRVVVSAWHANVRIVRVQVCSHHDCPPHPAGPDCDNLSNVGRINEGTESDGQLKARVR